MLIQTSMSCFVEKYLFYISLPFLVFSIIQMNHHRLLVGISSGSLTMISYDKTPNTIVYELYNTKRFSKSSYNSFMKLGIARFQLLPLMIRNCVVQPLNSFGILPYISASQVEDSRALFSFISGSTWNSISDWSL